jgi:hypothetical protein
MSDWDYGRPADGRYDAPQPSWPDGTTYPYPLPFPLAQAVDDDDMAFVDGYESPTQVGPPGEAWGDEAWGDEAAPEPPAPADDQFAATSTQAAVPRDGSSYPWPPAPPPAWLGDSQAPAEPEEPGGRREHGGRRWLLPAGLVAGAAALGAAAVLMTVGHRSAPAAGGGKASPSVIPSMAVMGTGKSPAPVKSPAQAANKAAGTGAPLTLTQAQAVLARYTAVNNSANAQRSTATLATIESGSSNAIDAGLYQEDAAEGQAPFPAFSAVKATYYIPNGEPAAGPRWFVVEVANAFTANPGKVTSQEYLLFTQAAPGDAWLNTIEPYLLSSTTAPQIAVGANGLATAVSPGAATVTVAPGQLSADTAAAFDGKTGTGQPNVSDPGNLADQTDERRGLAEVPGGTVTDSRAAASGANGQEFALRTTDGGALVFYTDTAQLTVTPAAGHALHLTVPGFLSSTQSMSSATVNYLEQFATYDPPAGGGDPRVVADYSGIVSAG